MKIIGHRGARGLATENTLEAIRKALDLHVDEVEFDIRVTKDNVPVLAHDSVIHAGTVPYSIKDHNFAELKKLYPQLATLDEALKLIGTTARVYVEVKRDEPVEPIIEVLKKYIGNSHHTEKYLLFGSRSQETLRALHSAFPEVELVIIEIWSSVRLGEGPASSAPNA